MKHPFILAFTALLLATLAALHAGRILPEVPNFGKIRVGSFQALETLGATASKVWN
jgi:hypothetical protein